MDWACLLEKREISLRGCVPIILFQLAVFRLFQLIKKVSVSKSINLSIYQSINLSVINKGVSFFQFLLSYYYNLLNIN